MGNKKWYQLDEEEVVKEWKSDPVKGLTKKEAEKRLIRYGPNKLQEGEEISPLKLLLAQFQDFMVLVLLGATLISGLMGEYVDAIAIIAIVLINAILGFIQEYRAEQSLAALKELSAPQAMVIRDGEMMKIPASQVVPGDLVRLESGDRVAADLRLLDVQGVKMEESALTGESVPVEKVKATIPDEDLPLGDQGNMAFMGTLVVQGTGRGIVVATGMETEMGKIAGLLHHAEETKTPLQYRLEQMGKVLVWLAIALTILVMGLGIWNGNDPQEMFLTGVSLAVAAIPEGLPTIVTIVLALGVQRMLKKNAIVRKLPSVETLGCTTVICTDKTGTLTQNKMTVTKIFANGEEWSVSGSGYEPRGEFYLGNTKKDPSVIPSLKNFLEVGVLCNNATLYERKEGKGRTGDWSIHGDPTEGALLVLAAKAGIWKRDLENVWVKEWEIPFDSERKRMSVLFRNREGKRILVVKGAVEELLERSSSVILHDRILPFERVRKEEWLRKNEDMAREGLRVLAIAYKEMEEGRMEKGKGEEWEEGLTCLGLAGMIDPPREEVKDSIRISQQAGMKVVMITGDHRLTAEAIGKQLGILPENGLTVTESELYNMSDEEFGEKVEEIYVYARVSPSHKLKIVQALQAKGHVVAMTGDGVNDAPAIKAADIGISMGMSGTEVAKEASDLILTDDHFSSIEAAVEEGRGIYDNIRKFIRFLLASNVGEILVMLFAMMMALPTPLLPLQILWVNLVTDGLPALALGLDKPEGDMMKEPPRNPKENIFARGLGWKIISRGTLIGLSTLGAFLLALNQGATLLTAQTIAFSTLVMAQLIHVFDCRSDRSIFHRNPLENKALVAAVLSSILLLVGVIYWGPAQRIFDTVSLTYTDWLWILLFAAVPSFLSGVLHLFFVGVKKGRK
ncbi:calcium-translocating P-type ATPase, SERCA-type [Thermicanus aegyptius]|uniref:calcium-translocating P-type ATPase, SERCA-type n=1 Tax=Thermicanus aegyptius TaxID=94009 RepID=UPI00041F682F|nr:calcium-translocating P-type ATPase, SERCA-type [Thermicanus aegyptius]